MENSHNNMTGKRQLVKLLASKSIFTWNSIHRSVDTIGIYDIVKFHLFMNTRHDDDLFQWDLKHCTVLQVESEWFIKSSTYGGPCQSGIRPVWHYTGKVSVINEKCKEQWIMAVWHMCVVKLYKKSQLNKEKWNEWLQLKYRDNAFS